MPLPGFISTPLQPLPLTDSGSATGVGYSAQIGNGVPVDVVQVLIITLDSALRRIAGDGRGDLAMPMRTMRGLLQLSLTHLNSDGLVPSSLVRQALTPFTDPQIASDVQFFLHAYAPTISFPSIVQQIDAGYYVGTRARDAQAAADAAAQRAHQAATDAHAAAALADEQAAAHAAALAAQAHAEAIAAQEHADLQRQEESRSSALKWVIGGLLLAGGVAAVVAVVRSRR